MFVTNLYEIYIDQFDHGADLQFNLRNPDGSDFDLTLYSVQFIIKKSKDIPDEESLVNITQTNLTNNSIIIPISKTLSQNTPGIYYYAIRLIKDDKYVNTIVQNKLVILNNTFRSEPDGV